MAGVGDIFTALRQVLLMQSRMDQLDHRVTQMAKDMGGLADGLSALRDRVSRIEGFIEGAARASERQFPRIEE